MKKPIDEKNKAIGKLKTFDQVFAKAAKSEVFKKEYSEELTRLRLASDIRKFRTAKNLTQEIVAQRANMPQSVIARIESGKYSISLATLNRVAQVLGKNVQLA
jgi:DNA-binding XRE family transcriptional regulator